MKTITFEVCSPEQAMAAIARDVEAGIPDTSARMVFASKDLLTKIMSEARWKILKVLCGTAGMQINDLATCLDRDVESVVVDVAALLNAGVVDRDVKQGIIFPYDEIALDLATTGRSTV